MMRNAADLIEPTDVSDDHPAFSGPEGILTYEELVRLARVYAGAVSRLGVQPGDRIAMLADACLDGIVALFGAHQLGAIHVPINNRYRPRELEHVIHDSGARWIAVDRNGAETLLALPELRAQVRLIGLADAPLHAVDVTIADLLRAGTSHHRIPNDDETAVLVYTSGTTGRSKGAALTYGNIVAGIGALTDLWEWSARDKIVLALPLFHVHGLALGVYGSVLHRAHVLLHRRFRVPDVVHDFAQREASVFLGVPTMYGMILDHLQQHPQDAATLSKARLFAVGSAALSPEVFARFEALTSHRVLERYGMTETLLSLSNPYRGERRPGSVGLPVPGYAVRVVSEEGRECDANVAGELWVRGAGVMPRYWQREDADRDSFVDGWFRTGDVVSRSDDGYFRIIGRLSTDIVKSGGYKIATREIEEAIPELPELAESVVIGLPHPQWGQIVAVAVAPRHELNENQMRDLLARLAASVSTQLADYKKPRALVPMPFLPRNAMGKVQKTEIVQLVASGQLQVIML